MGILKWPRVGEFGWPTGGIGVRIIDADSGLAARLAGSSDWQQFLVFAVDFTR